jgi:hypothetical protein
LKRGKSGGVGNIVHPREFHAPECQPEQDWQNNGEFNRGGTVAITGAVLLVLFFHLAKLPIVQLEQTQRD